MMEHTQGDIFFYNLTLQYSTDYSSLFEDGGLSYKAVYNIITGELDKKKLCKMGTTTQLPIVLKHIFIDSC